MQLPTLSHFRRSLEVFRTGVDKSFGLVVYRYFQGQRLYLVIRHQKKHWAFPKGHPEGGEDPLETAKREVAEETGVTQLKIDTEKSFEESYFFKLWRKKIHKTVCFWTAETESADVMIQLSEVSEFKWATAAEALELITFDVGKNLLTEVEQYLQSKESSNE